MEVKELKKEKHWREANDPKREGREKRPLPPGILYEYQNKGDAREAVCMNVKRKQLEILGQWGRATRGQSRQK